MDFPLSQDITKLEPNFRILSDIELIEREDIEFSDALKTAGWIDGQWVKIDGNGKLVDSDATATRNSFCVWTGSEKSGSPTPDTYATGKLTVLTGAGYIAQTKQFTGTPTVGDLLVAKSGKLVKAADAAEERVAVAVCHKPVASGILIYRAL